MCNVMVTAEERRSHLGSDCTDMRRGPDRLQATRLGSGFVSSTYTSLQLPDFLQ